MPRGKRPRFYRRKLQQLSPVRGFVWKSAKNRFALSNAECKIIIYAIPRARANVPANKNNIDRIYTDLFEKAVELIDQVEKYDDPSLFWSAVLPATYVADSPDFTGALAHRFSLVAIDARARAKRGEIPSDEYRGEDETTQAVDSYTDKMWTMYGDPSNTEEKRRKYNDYLGVASEPQEEDDASDTSEENLDDSAGDTHNGNDKDDVHGDRVQDVAVETDTITNNSGAMDGTDNNALKQDTNNVNAEENDPINTDAAAGADAVNDNGVSATTLESNEDDAAKGDINDEAIKDNGTTADTTEDNPPKDDVNDDNTIEKDVIEGNAGEDSQKNIKEA
ncbi:hypothetical protein F5Y18DRAFT_444825 [Xylariaceae sp. FL1019]|nr:hypothetical protein F5Y18DRAFT_444825 [Xylariaceae sp. FL1019]